MSRTRLTILFAAACRFNPNAIKLLTRDGRWLASRGGGRRSWGYYFANWSGHFRGGDGFLCGQVKQHDQLGHIFLDIEPGANKPSAFAILRGTSPGETVHSGNKLTLHLGWEVKNDDAGVGIDAVKTDPISYFFYV
jgi:hypothetical protein